MIFEYNDPMHRTRDSAVSAALGAALLFGASTPLAKLLLAETRPWMLAGLLYLGSGCGLWLLRRTRGTPPARLSAAEWRWLAGAIAAGGVLAPVLLMAGLTRMAAAPVSLLLNAEGVLTALLAWFAFSEHVDTRIAIGMGAIVAGAGVLGWPVGGALTGAAAWPALAVLGACLGWAVDNNLTRKVALADATWIAMIKGLAAGVTNLLLALGLGAPLPAPADVAGASVVGFLCYGTSLSLFVRALRDLGTARTGAYFSVAPFFGALLSLVLLGEPVTPSLLAGGLLMGVGVYLHVTEEHVHEHAHDSIEHEHEHVHGDGDDHHHHPGEEPTPPGTRHRHPHRHEALSHTHGHYPDAHHQHLH